MLILTLVNSIRVIDQGGLRNLADTNHNSELYRKIEQDQNSISLDQNTSRENYKL